MPDATTPASDSPGIDTLERHAQLQAERGAEEQEQVTPLELFFDLVFVFAITQVTAFIAADPSWEGLVRGLMILAVVWWAWVAYAWLTNTLDAAEGRTRIVMFLAMAAMFVSALAIPGAFNDDSLLFACAYLVVRAAHILLYGYAANDVGVQSAVKRLAPSVFVSCGLLIAASGFDGAAQGAFWAAAIVIDYLGPVLGGMEGWTMHSGHFAERHGLIIIIAFGESIVATGIGAEGIELSAQVIAAALLGVAVAAALWWAYFDVVALVAEGRLRDATGVEQTRLARDAYSYIHLPMVAGIVLLAVALKKTIGDVEEPLKIVPTVALCGGVALYLLGHIAFRLRNVGSLNRHRLLAALLCLALIPLATNIDALLALAVIAAVCIALTVFEVVRFREARERVRAAAGA